MHEGLLSTGEAPKNKREREAVELAIVVAQIAQELDVLIREHLTTEKQALSQSVRIVDTEGRINPGAFAHKHGGPYAKTTPKEGATVAHEASITDDETLVAALESEWIQREGPEGPNPREAWKALRARSDGGIAELVLFSLLHRALKNEHIVVRTAPYDDYTAHVDLLVIDRKTGKVVCALDEVTGSADDVHTRRKHGRAQALLDDGFTVKYGLSVDAEGSISRSTLRGVPGVPLRITREELLNLLEMHAYTEATITSPERDMLLNILNRAIHDAHSTHAQERISTLITTISNEIQE